MAARRTEPGFRGTMDSVDSLPRLDLMPRDQFALLALHDKNAYLQELAKDFCAKTGRVYEPLTKDGLSRLRRYYSRRVFADLKLKDDESPIEQALRGLGEAIHHDHMRTDVTAALVSDLPRRPTLRPAPIDDAQLMFFVPAIYDAPLKDDVNLMDIAPFTLSKKSKPGLIQYELKDSIITIEGGAQSGIATAFDYDIFLHMVSHLAEEIRQFRIDESNGKRPSLPPKVYRPNASHILKFGRRSSGGKAYADLEKALDRLKNTSIKIVNLAGGKRRQVDTRSLIADYNIVSKTSSGYIDLIEIVIPDWVYMSLVKDDRALPILTLHPDYFLISSAIGRVIYRLARKVAKHGESHFKVADLHHRSGSTQELRFFTRDLRKFVETTQIFPLPDYDLDLSTGRTGPVLHMRFRKAGKAPAPGQIELQEDLPLAD